MDVELKKFDYKYMAYETELLKLELSTLLPHTVLEINGRHLLLKNVSKSDLPILDKLTYIASYSVDGTICYSQQYQYEQNKNKCQKRQNTRYASHGIHEYKGKFNPQIVHALINILGISNNEVVFDPFCGSGTTLVESSLHGIDSYGIDINPLAIKLSTLKVDALKLDCTQARKALSFVLERLSGANDTKTLDETSPRRQYLLKWLPRDIYTILEHLLLYSETLESTIALLFKITASNLIREYSLQEPLDLRIRRRTSPMPDKPFLGVWAELVIQQIENIEYAQKKMKYVPAKSSAVQNDIRTVSLGKKLFDVAITSPPYATALPYIDTQRISLVWLGLCEPNEIMNLESSLIGSREFYRVQREDLYDKMLSNINNLPFTVYNLIMRLQNGLSDQDGFRKKAVPLLLYRYFSDMKTMFINVSLMLKPHAKYALVVGNNKTTIGGELNVIDTPDLLREIAEQSRWKVLKMMPLQTYQRYGLNSKNAINRETLMVLEKDTE